MGRYPDIHAVNKGRNATVRIISVKENIIANGAAICQPRALHCYNKVSLRFKRHFNEE